MVSEQTHELEGVAAFAAAAAELASRARREIALRSYQLPAELYGTSAFSEAVKQMIVTARGQRARVRILVGEPRYAAAGNRLVTLGQELTSFITFHRPAPEHADWQGECLVIDRAHVLERHSPESVRATCCIDSPLDARNAMRHFDAAWEMAEPAPELRRLNISG